MTLPDNRIIELIDRLIAAGTIASRQEFLDTIGMLKQNYTEVVNGKRSFRMEHISKACREYDVNANWIMGIDEQVFRTKKRTISQTGNSVETKTEH